MAVTVTILLMRHGLSCSNVLDGCMTHIENVDQAFQPHIFDAIDRELVDTPCLLYTSPSPRDRG